MVANYPGGNTFGASFDQQAKDVQASLLRESGQSGDDVGLYHDSIYIKTLLGFKPRFLGSFLKA